MKVKAANQARICASHTWKQLFENAFVCFGSMQDFRELHQFLRLRQPELELESVCYRNLLEKESSFEVNLLMLKTCTVLFRMPLASHYLW